MIICLLGQTLAAQDRTVRLMTYNILNYRNTTSYCTGSNNNSSNKEAALETIIQAIEPDLVVLNEIGSNPNNLTLFTQQQLQYGQYDALVYGPAHPQWILLFGKWHCLSQ